ncbi:MAG: HAMP domain-containing histidine kinase [Clostridia bacterium]|nr:HAMP domain-containing histidine kinase [Clostridia bacterium]
MNKLKDKVFYVLTLILTIFLISILAIFNYQSYNREKEAVKNSLKMMENERNGMEQHSAPRFDEENKGSISNDFEGGFKEEERPKRVFMDSVVYTVILGENNSISEIVNHTDNDIDEDKIRNIATKILVKTSSTETNVGNLYFDDYSYSLKANKSLVIVDNSKRKEILIKDLKISFAIFAVLEIIIVFVSKRLTRWIIKPAVEALDKQKRFITDASHELKTPIAVIQANSEALESDFQEKWIDNIKSETERMNRLISNLLDLAKLENGQEKMLYSQNDLSKIVERSALTFESSMFEKNIKLKLDIEKNIKFNCDSDQIKQLLAILIDNAIKHSDEKGEIKVSLLNDRNNIKIEVINKGNPIPKGAEEKIFERFYRVDESRNRNENRYGLGLAIAKSIVINHGGKVFAESNNGYTTFKVLFRR